jgi:Family of unknown function (DUF5947)
VAAASNAFASSRLRRLAAPRGERAAAEPVAEEHCDLCNVAIPSEHRHLRNLESGELLCACRPCAVLFDRGGAGGGHLRTVPDRRLRLLDFELSDLAWERLRIPVEMAFFFESSPAERVQAFYPSPMGATESLLELTAWQELERANPVLREMEPDVEALLVNRSRAGGEEPSYWLLPIDDCYSLVAVIRTRWRGFAGGREAWREIGDFFAGLERRSKPYGGAPAEGEPEQASAEPARSAERRN